MLSRREFLVASAAITASTAYDASAQQPVSSANPNILFILADDLGWGDLSCYGRPDYKTPVLDDLAARGVRLTQAYANSSTCSPTRVALITGRYQTRLPVGLYDPLPGGAPAGLPPQHPTLPSLLRTAGLAFGGPDLRTLFFTAPPPSTRCASRCRGGHTPGIGSGLGDAGPGLIAAGARGACHSRSGTKIETRGSGPTSRVAWPWPVRSSAIRMSPGPRRRIVPSPISMSTAPDSVNTAARPGAWCQGLDRAGAKRR